MIGNVTIVTAVMYWRVLHTIPLEIALWSSLQVLGSIPVLRETIGFTCSAENFLTHQKKNENFSKFRPSQSLNIISMPGVSVRYVSASLKTP